MIKAMRHRMQQFFIFFLLLSGGMVDASVKPPLFSQEIQTYYCDAGWICRAFEMMSVVEFVQSWNSLAKVLGDEHKRWFYGHDLKKVYASRLSTSYATLERYKRESLDINWLKECTAYHTFLKTYVLDNERGTILKKDTRESFKLDYKKRYTDLLDVLIQMAPDALISFYSFFFEQVSNIILKKLNYLYEVSELATMAEYTNIIELIRHRELLSQLYQISTHKLGQTSSIQARKMSYHYNRLESVIELVVSDVLKRINQ